MLFLIRKKICFFRPFRSNIGHAYFLSTSIVKPLVNISNSTDSQFNTVSFLLNSCGFSLESANLASKKLQIRSTDKPDTVLDFLITHGLTQTHIKSLITSRPVLLLVDPDKTLKPNFELFGKLGISGTNLVKVLNREPKILECDFHTIVDFFRTYGFTDNQIASLTFKCPVLFTYHPQKCLTPKFEYFESLGLSRELIAQLLTVEPSILERSLENHIKPSVEFIWRYAGTKEHVIRAIVSCYRILVIKIKEALAPNMDLLMDHGEPKSNALKLMMIQNNCLVLRTDRFAEVVKHVKELGFDPGNMLFILAIRSIAGMSKSKWDRKFSIFCSFGFSKDDILSAFRLQPMCMMTSEEKLKKLLGFFIKELKMKPSTISKTPNILLLSLERRILPRCSVLKLLISKDLLDRKKRLIYFMRMTENIFVSKFVIKYQDLIPEIVEAHLGKIKFQGFPVDFNV